MRRAREFLLAASFISACASDEPDVRQYRDVGQVCLESSDGQRLTFRVGTGDQCLTSCDEDVVSCRATLEGTRIDLSTLLETTPIPGVEICTAGCESAAGTCVLDVPSPGTYRSASPAASTGRRCRSRERSGCLRNSTANPSSIHPDFGEQHERGGWSVPDRRRQLPFAAAAADLPSAAGQTIKASAQTIATGHHLRACLARDVTPSCRDSKPSAHLVERTKRRLKAKPRVTSAVADTFGNIEAHATQSLPNLRGEIPISLGDGLDQRPSRRNELNDTIEEKLS
jgi:hypothetical protein